LKSKDESAIIEMVQEFACGTDIEIELSIAQDTYEHGASMRIVHTFKQYSWLFSFTTAGISSSLWSSKGDSF